MARACDVCTRVMTIWAHTRAVEADKTDIDALVAVLSSSAWGCDGEIVAYLVIKALCTLFAMD